MVQFQYTLIVPGTGLLTSVDISGSTVKCTVLFDIVRIILTLTAPVARYTARFGSLFVHLVPAQLGGHSDAISENRPILFVLYTFLIAKLEVITQHRFLVIIFYT